MLVEFLGIFFFKYKIFFEQYNEILDLGFYTSWSLRDTECKILLTEIECYVMSQQEHGQFCSKMLYGYIPKKDDL